MMKKADSAGRPTTSRTKILTENTFRCDESTFLSSRYETNLYNEQWILQRHGYKTPAQVRREKREIQFAEAAG